MKNYHRGPRSRSRPSDAMPDEHPDPYGEFPSYIEAMLDGAAGASKRERPSRQ